MMAAPVQTKPATPTEDAFVADRQAFWTRFTGFTKYSAIAIAVLLLLMWVFLG